uniref:Uncharacterized protein n=1 Tax=Anopheles atroparvus TaxID=41427 RepID=A0A182IML9_ANOAO
MESLLCVKPPLLSLLDGCFRLVDKPGRLQEERAVLFRGTFHVRIQQTRLSSMDWVVHNHVLESGVCLEELILVFFRHGQLAHVQLEQDPTTAEKHQIGIFRDHILCDVGSVEKCKLCICFVRCHHAINIQVSALLDQLKRHVMSDVHASPNFNRIRIQLPDANPSLGILATRHHFEIA